MSNVLEIATEQAREIYAQQVYQWNTILEDNEQWLENFEYFYEEIKKGRTVNFDSLSVKFPQISLCSPLSKALYTPLRPYSPSFTDVEEEEIFTKPAEGINDSLAALQASLIAPISKDNMEDENLKQRSKRPRNTENYESDYFELFERAAKRVKRSLENNFNSTGEEFDVQNINKEITGGLSEVDLFLDLISRDKENLNTSSPYRQPLQLDLNVYPFDPDYVELNFLAHYDSNANSNTLKNNEGSLNSSDDIIPVPSPPLKAKFDAVAHLIGSPTKVPKLERCLKSNEKENIEIKNNLPLEVPENKQNFILKYTPEKSKNLSIIANTKSITVPEGSQVGKPCTMPAPMDAVPKTPRSLLKSTKVPSLTKQKPHYFVLNGNGAVTSSPFKVGVKSPNLCSPKSPLKSPNAKSPAPKHLPKSPLKQINNNTPPVSPGGIRLTASSVDRMRMPPPCTPPHTIPRHAQSPFRCTTPSERYSLASPLLSRPPTTPKYSPIVSSLFGYSPASGEEYLIGDYYFNSEDSSEDEEKEAQKNYKYWCRKENLIQILQRQALIDPDAVFGEKTNATCDLEKIFGVKRRHYQRSDRFSGVWSPELNYHLK